MRGCWLSCLPDVTLTPAAECRGLRKPAWIVLISVTFIGGAIAWLIVRQPADSSSAPLARTPRWDPDRPAEPSADFFRAGRWTAADDAIGRHPAGRARAAGPGRGPPIGPDRHARVLRVREGGTRG